MKIIEHYDDKEVIGRWGVVRMNSDGTFYKHEFDPEGNMTAHTVKAIENNGKVSLLRVWEAEEAWKG